MDSSTDRRRGNRSGRPSIPIVAGFPATLARDDADRIRALATRLLRQRPNLGATAPFGAGVRSGLGPHPAVLIGDQSEIPLYGLPEAGHLQYRMALLAGAGDVLVIGGARNRDFEAYLCDLLGLSRLEVLVAEPDGQARTPIARRCLEQPEILQRLTQMARRAGGLTLLAYLTTGHVWNLASAISRRAGVPVEVAGPPPQLSKAINDKLWFADRLQDLFGRPDRRPTHAVYGPSALAQRAAHLARRSRRIVIKVPDSAGSAGNLSLAAADIAGMSLPRLRAHLVDLLASMGWGGRFPLAVEIWQEAVIASPSVQIWIPARSDGLPIVEGLFEQVVEGDMGEFVGAVPSALPETWRRRLVEESVQIAFLFQNLGYFGQCSFDAIVSGADLATADLRWIECNGRWGGVSVPLVFANRLADHEAQCVIVQRKHVGIEPRRFADLLAEFADLRPGRHRREGVVFLTPEMVERGSGFHFMTLAPSVDRARQQALEVQRRLRRPAEKKK